MILKNSINQLLRGEDLEATVCHQVMDAMLEQDANPLQTAAFLVLLRAKMETAEELAALVSALKKRMLPVPVTGKVLGSEVLGSKVLANKVLANKVLDIVGTGGDHANTVNISTGSAILAASCGVKIAKHGNRAVSSLSGSADVLEALGIAINLTPEKVGACIDEIGIGFCFSPNFHPAMRALRALRQQLGVATTFNILGPLLNPSSPAHYLLGVYDAALLPLMAEALKKTGTERSIVVHGYGLDEISCMGVARVLEITPAGVMESSIDPEKFGLVRCTLEELRGGNAETNAQILIEIFSSNNKTKNNRKGLAETLILNAAVALYLYGIYPSVAAGITHARENLYTGAALKLLNKWIEFSHD
jgi:anthranilate phosphoribosyltransferase